jgi:hypothetical protein
MIRIIIEIDDKHVSFTSTGPATTTEPPRELLDRALELGATSAGGAPTGGVTSAEATNDAGGAPEAAGASESTGTAKPRRASE